MRFFCHITLIALAGLLSTTRAFADLATVHLSDGKVVTVELVAVERAQVQWKENTLPNSPVQAFSRAVIAHVDFPETGSWRDAEAAFESGKFAEAIALYRNVIADAGAHFYPIPGNFVSLAQVRILECHRAKMDPVAITAQAKVVKKESANLPPAMRTMDPVVDAWSAVPRKQWDVVLKSLEGVKLPGPESYFLKGVALENLGEWQKAIQEYSGAYVLNFGGPTEITKQALRRSAALLAKQKIEVRTPELQAQAKIYRDLFGDGKLWDGAPPWLTELANGKIDTIKTEVSGDFDGKEPEKAKAQPGTPAADGAQPKPKPGTQTPGGAKSKPKPAPPAK